MFTVVLGSLTLPGCQAVPVDTKAVIRWGQECGLNNLKVGTVSEKIFYLDEPGNVDPQLDLPSNYLNDAERARKRDIEKALPCMNSKASNSDAQIQYARARPVI